MYPKYIYVAGPFNQGNVLDNARRGIEAGHTLLEAGFTPFIPHLNVLWEFLKGADYEKWMAWDQAWLAKCDAMVRLPGYSPGADREQAFCRENNIPVYFGLDNFFDSIAWGHNPLEADIRDALAITPEGEPEG